MLLHVNAAVWLWLLIAILIVWRLTTLICYEAGPFNIMSKFRILLYRIRLGSIIDCFHCTALWIAAIVTIGIYDLHIASFFLTFAIAGGASIIERILSYFVHLKEQENEND